MRHNEGKEQKKENSKKGRKSAQSSISFPMKRQKSHCIFRFLSVGRVLCARGKRDIPSTLGFREGMEGAVNALAADASKQEFGGTSTNVLSANCLSQCVFDVAGRAAGGRHYVLCNMAKYLRC